MESGEISLNGKVAYAAQSPWILNATLRDNILFGQPMDKKRYEKVLSVCQLSHDLEMLDDGDLTEIGEKGINLSVSDIVVAARYTIPTTIPLTFFGACRTNTGRAKTTCIDCSSMLLRC